VRELVIENGKSVITCDVEAAQVLCDHFQESLTVETQADEDMNNEIKPECTFSLIVDFDESVVVQKLQQLKSDKSPRPDGLHPMSLSCCAEELCLPLSLTYQKS